jgi:hypothetical protein
MNAAAKWTFMVYMAGDNDLSGAGESDLAEMSAVGASADLNVLVEFDPQGRGGTDRHVIHRGGAGGDRLRLPETNSADPKALNAFITWAARNHPAERYALVLWGHGSGWEPAEKGRGASSRKVCPDAERKGAHPPASADRAPFFKPVLKSLSKDRRSKRAVCFDDGSGHSLDTVELGRVLHKAARALGRPLDILGMDACLMSNIEVACQAGSHVRHIVASETLEPYSGWPYAKILKLLTGSPHAASADVAAQMARACVPPCPDRDPAFPVARSALNLSAMDQLTHPLSHLAEALITHMPRASREIFTAQRDSLRFQRETLWDIADFCRKLETTTSSRKVRSAARKVRAALRPGWGRFVSAKAHSGSGLEHCGGVSIYLQPPTAPISKHYSRLAFAREHPWWRLLKAYHSNPV